MIVTITQTFDWMSHRYFPGDVQDVDPQVGQRWINEGKATLGGSQASGILNTLLTGLSTASAVAITALDSVIGAFGKLMALINTKADASAIQNLNGTANQITVTQTDANNITLSLPAALTLGAASFSGLLSGKGTSDGSEVAAGNIGEYNQFVLVASGASVPIAAGSPSSVVNVGSGLLTKGRWLVFFETTWNPNGNTLTSLLMGISTSSAALPTNDYNIVEEVRTATVPAANPHLMGFRYINLPADSTLYLVAQAINGGTVNVYGSAFAIRLP